MSVEENKESIRRHIEEVWNKGNLTLIPEFYDPGVIWHTLGGDIKGLDGVKQIAAAFRTAFPDFHMTIDDMVGEGDKVVFRWTFSGTHRGEYMGIAPTGKKVSFAVISINSFEGGKQVEAWIVSDRLGMYQQLGVTPPTG